MRGNILIVDDEKGQREILRTILEAEGYGVRMACGGQEAVEAMDKTGFDLVITDLRMPGMGGDALIEHIRLERPSTSIVVVTAHWDLDSPMDAIRLGVFDYLPKPLDRERLLAVSARAIEQSRLQSGKHRAA